MKLKLLATCVAVAALAGCGDDVDSSTIQAYDGAIKGIEGTYTCTKDSGKTISGVIPKTDATGEASISNKTVRFSPQNCTFTFVKTPGAVDVSNGKDMSDLSLSIPKGFAQSGSAPKATPFTTLVTKALNGAEYTESDATTVLQQLGLGDLINEEGVSVSDIMTDLETVVTKLKDSGSANYSKLLATTHVLSDVLAKSQDENSTASGFSVDQIANAAQNIVAKTIKIHANYPISSTTGGEIVINIKEDSSYNDLTFVADKVLPDSALNDLPAPKEQESKPVTDSGDNTGTDTDTDTDTDTGTGGTGGTGTGSDGSGTGDD